MYLRSSDLVSSVESLSSREIIYWHRLSKRQESSRKTSISALLAMPKPLTVWITINWKILEEMGIPDHLNGGLKRLLEKPVCRSGSNN